MVIKFITQLLSFIMFSLFLKKKKEERKKEKRLCLVKVRAWFELAAWGGKEYTAVQYGTNKSSQIRALYKLNSNY
jgi:hypothetical protein